MEPTETQENPAPGEARALEEMKQEHRRLDERIAELESQLTLTPDEHMQAAVMKKRKLALRDRIELASQRA